MSECVSVYLSVCMCACECVYMCVCEYVCMCMCECKTWAYFHTHLYWPASSASVEVMFRVCAVNEALPRRLTLAT